MSLRRQRPPSRGRTAPRAYRDRNSEGTELVGC
jgi:hypothetical protein